MTRATRELQDCEIVRAPIEGARGRASFASRVSRLLRLGYRPLGVPHFAGNTATLAMTRIDLDAQRVPADDADAE